MEKLLLIVDPQNDFINGSLPVPGAQAAMDALADYVASHGSEYVSIAVTTDFHPARHKSFVDNGGEWPRHCVAHSAGAAIYPALLDALRPYNYMVYTKGTDTDREEYSVFSNRQSAADLAFRIHSLRIAKIDICGLAGDVCVLNTLLDGQKMFPEIKFNVLVEYSPSLDGGVKLQQAINE